jgi:hypothetical protein
LDVAALIVTWSAFCCSIVANIPQRALVTCGR